MNHRISLVYGPHLWFASEPQPPVRKNALFYKTQNGAQVGDLFMSLIDTCEMNQANPFDYLTQLQRHADAIAASPQLWMPWNYRDAEAS